MTWVTLIGVIVTAIVGPLLAFFLKRWVENQIANAKAEARQKEEEQKAREEHKQAGDTARDVNTSIDAQKAARDKWARENGKP